MLIDIAYIIIGVVVAVFSGFFYGRRSGSKSEREIGKFRLVNKRKRHMKFQKG